jgi:hypothetical protein
MASTTMKILVLTATQRAGILFLGLWAACATSVWAFPPAPHHLFYGMLRDEYGAPITAPGTQVILATSSGVQITTSIIPHLEPGVNYRLEVPMDSGLTSKLYIPTALRPSVPFQLKVRIGSTTYLPIEMKGKFAALGGPSERTHLNLTLGEDADGDGLPDAWERLINSDISKVNPHEDSDGDGLTNLQEYLAGTYAYDPEDGFVLEIMENKNGFAKLSFLALAGRTYTLERTTDLKTWVPVGFRQAGEPDNSPLRSSFRSGDVHTVHLEAPSESEAAGMTYFRLIVH